MKTKRKILLISIVIFTFILSACVRPASGAPDSVPTSNATLPNPVSTQSQLMKDIIAGTQTAMALASGDVTPEATAEGTVEETQDAEAKDVEEEEPTTAPALPTSTAGPPPVVELVYNNKSCGPELFICEVSVLKDQSVTIQGTNGWLTKDFDLTFTMRPNGTDETQGIVVGTAIFDADGSPGFQAVLNIPDSLRGFDIIIVRMESDKCSEFYGTECYGQMFFSNLSVD